MSQVRNHIPNPSAETNTTGIAAIPGTTGVAAITRVAATGAFGASTARCTWSTASTAAGGGIYWEVDIAAVGLAVGDTISAGIFMARSSINQRVVGRLEFRTNVATISTTDAAAQRQLTAATWAGSVIGSATALDAAQKIQNVVIPATTTKIRVHLQSVAGTGYQNWSIGSTLDADGVQINKGAALADYIDGARGWQYAWAGTAHASVSTFYTPIISAIAVADADAPGPRAVITIDDIPPAAVKLTLLRTSDRRQWNVRGSVKVAVVSGYSTPDVEAPFNVESSYRAQFLDNAGLELGYSTSAAVTVTSDVSWVHNVLDPYGAAQIDVEHDSALKITRRSEGDIQYAERRTLGVLLAGQRRGVTDVALHLSTDSFVGADAFQDMLGGYDDASERLPILCIRTPAPYDRLPRTFFAAVLEVDEMPITAHMGGQLVEFEAKADEVAPPFPGIVVPLLTRNDIDAFYATRNLLDAGYARRSDIDRDYSKAGTA